MTRVRDTLPFRLVTSGDALRLLVGTLLLAVAGIVGYVFGRAAGP